MRKYKDVTVTFNDPQTIGRYYDPVNKREGNGAIPEGCVPIEEPRVVALKRKFKISKADVEKYGTEILPDEPDE